MFNMDLTLDIEKKILITIFFSMLAININNNLVDKCFSQISYFVHGFFLQWYELNV